MKKFILFVLFILVLLPWNVQAFSIKSSSILGASEKEVGDEFSLLVKISFSDLDKNDPNSLGIWLLSCELIFDDSVFTVTDITSEDWVSGLYKVDGKYYIFSEVGPDARNLCMNGAVFCGDYFVTLHLFVNDTTVTSSVVQMGEIEVGLLDMKDPDKTYTLDDLQVVNGNSNQSQTIQIKQTGSDTSSLEVPKSIVEEEKPALQEPEITSQNKETTVTSAKSSNNYLRLLEVEAYQLDFDKMQNEYQLVIDADVHALNVKVALEDERATYKIIGDQNLDENDHKVVIEVTAEDGEKNTYTIVTKSSSEEEDIPSDTSSDSSFKDFLLSIDKKYFMIGGGVFLFLLFILLIVRYLGNRKLEKALDRL